MALPASWLEAVGICVLVVGILLAIHGTRTAATQGDFFRLGALMTALAVTVIANDRWVYLVALFIFSSLFAEHGFLLTLAALLHGGNAPYFEYLTAKERTERSKRDIISQVPPATVRDKPAIDELVNEAGLAETRVLDLYAATFDRPVLRGVRLRGHVGAEVDGIVTTPTYDMLLEVKYVPLPQRLQALLPSWIARLRETANAYQQTTNRSVLPRLVVVLNAPDETTARAEEAVRRLLDETPPVTIQWVSADELRSRS